MGELEIGKFGHEISTEVSVPTLPHENALDSEDVWVANYKIVFGGRGGMICSVSHEPGGEVVFI